MTNIIMIVISQINLLLCLINDILDHKLIEENKFVPKIEKFMLRDTFNFISNMFANQMKMQKTELRFEAVAHLQRPF